MGISSLAACHISLLFWLSINFSLSLLVLDEMEAEVALGIYTVSQKTRHFAHNFPKC